MVTPRQPPAAVPQAEQGDELLDELDRGRASAQRPDVDRRRGRRRGPDLEDREPDVQAAAHPDPLVDVLELRVARRPQPADRAVLEQQGAEVGRRRLMLDGLGTRRPGRRRRGRREVRPHACAHAHRLADVEDLPRVVAHDVDAGRVADARHVRQPAPRAARERAAVGRAGAPPPRRAARAEQRDRVPDGRGARAEPREQRAEDAGARLGVGERAVRRLHVDAERTGERDELALPRERMQAPRERHRAHRDRVRPFQARPIERLREDAPVERRAVRDQDAPAQELAELGEARLGGRRVVHHRLGDPGEPLDALRQRPARRDERLPAVVELAAADEDGPHLGELAGLSGEAVRLGVDDEELGGAQRCGGVHPPRSTKAPGRRARHLARRLRPPADGRSMVRAPEREDA